jgi:hypothetical protein
MQRLVLSIFCGLVVIWCVWTYSKAQNYSATNHRKPVDNKEPNAVSNIMGKDTNHIMQVNDSIEIAEADSIFMAQTIKETMAKYRIEFNREPPRGFGHFVKVAVENKCSIEVPRMKWLLGDLEPFRRISPQAYKARVKLLATQSENAIGNIYHYEFSDSSIARVKHKDKLSSGLKNHMHKVL